MTLNKLLKGAVLMSGMMLTLDPHVFAMGKDDFKDRDIYDYDAESKKNIESINFSFRAHQILENFLLHKDSIDNIENILKQETSKYISDSSKNNETLSSNKETVKTLSAELLNMLGENENIFHCSDKRKKEYFDVLTTLQELTLGGRWQDRYSFVLIPVLKQTLRNLLY